MLHIKIHSCDSLRRYDRRRVAGYTPALRSVGMTDGGLPDTLLRFAPSV